MRSLSPSTRIWLSLGLAGAVAAAVFWLAPTPESSPTPIANTDRPAPATPAKPPQPVKEPGLANTTADADTPGTEVIASTPRTWDDAPLAPSLAGTEIDGSLRADASGHLIVDLQTKDFFDYMLSAVGQVSPEEALDAITDMARSNLPPDAAQEAINLLGRYIDYKRQALALSQTPLDPARASDPAYQLDQLRKALADLKALRRNVLSPETADAFYGLEEAYGEYTLASLEIQQRDDLSPQAQQTLIEWQRQQLPAPLRHTENQLVADTQQSLNRQEALNKASSPAEAAEQLRSLGMASEQAQQVETYLQERDQFDSQYAAYQKERAQLEDAGLAPADKAKREDALLADYFDNERTRTWARLRQLDTASP
ncbi:lipase chaperone [Marinobacter sp. R17]|uniref:lipase secretion chaperone n=1 Tax=Marinobacter sp. R17 TaxID=2484250 RepID=UPI000F4CAC59|nr:lipase secretion chaperone [Marinobacter sp. R17]ROT95741.1 lipase chaperone [Marinobacter sp. R17]